MCCGVVIQRIIWDEGQVRGWLQACNPGLQALLHQNSELQHPIHAMFPPIGMQLVCPIDLAWYQRREHAKA